MVVISQPSAIDCTVGFVNQWAVFCKITQRSCLRIVHVLPLEDRVIEMPLWGRGRSSAPSPAPGSPL
jgi:hypothetical protein